MCQYFRVLLAGFHRGCEGYRTFYERLDEELRRALRYEAPLPVVLKDLDYFKAVNDTGGHQFGDALLIRCAELMRDELRQAIRG